MIIGNEKIYLYNICEWLNGMRGGGIFFMFLNNNNVALQCNFWKFYNVIYKLELNYS
jgi:hypothetical protein